MARTRSAIALLALLALTLPLTIGATPEPEEGVGDASAGLLAAHLKVDDEGGLSSATVDDLLAGLVGHVDLLDALDTSIDLELLEGLTTATTREVPDAVATLSPLRLGGQSQHEVTAGPGEREEGAAVPATPLSALLAGVGLSPYSVEADADEDLAVARIDAVSATLDVLGATGAEIGLTGVLSEVTRTGSRAEQDLSVDDLAIGLGDLLPPELLGLLPLDSMLDLLEVLGETGLRDQLNALISDVAAAVDDLALDLDALDAVDPALLTQLEDLLALQEQLEALDVASLESTISDTLAELDGLVGSVAAGDSYEAALLHDGELVDGVVGDDGLIDGGDLPDVGDLPIVGDLTDEVLDDIVSGVLDPADVLVTDLDLDGVTSELQDIIALLAVLDAEDDITLPADCPTELSSTLGGLLEDAEALAVCVQDVLDQLVGAIDGLLAELAAQLGIEGLLAPLQGLLTDLNDLATLIDTIRDRAVGIADLDLLTADTLDLEVVAAATAAGGSTSIVCDLGGVEILGEALGSLSCDGGTLGSGVDATVDAALGMVGDLLEALPGVSGVDGLRLDLLPVATESVSTDEDGTVTSRAHAVLLELVVPSVTIDPAEALDLLEGLPGLDDLPVLGDLGDIDGLLDAVLGELGTDLGLGTGELAALTGVLDDVLVTADGLLGQIGEALGGALDLDVLDLQIATPSIELVLDPVSEATFTAQAEEAPGGTGSTPTPTPVTTSDPSGTDPDGPAVTTADPGTPELPKTGGGIALLGLLALLGAVGLRRTG